MFLSLLHLLLGRLIAAFTSWPSGKEWLRTVALLLILATAMWLLGCQGRFFHVVPLPSVVTGLIVLATAFLSPALVEETVFRVLLIPQGSEVVTAATRWLWVVGSWLLYVASHLVNGWLFKRKVFQSPLFLLLAGILGIGCTAAYCWSGSIWPSILFHWLIVTVWLIGFGGYRMIQR